MTLSSDQFRPPVTMTVDELRIACRSSAKAAALTSEDYIRTAREGKLVCVDTDGDGYDTYWIAESDDQEPVVSALREVAEFARNYEPPCDKYGEPCTEDDWIIERGWSAHKVTV